MDYGDDAQNDAHIEDELAAIVEHELNTAGRQVSAQQRGAAQSRQPRYTRQVTADEETNDDDDDAFLQIYGDETESEIHNEQDNDAYAYDPDGELSDNVSDLQHEIRELKRKINYDRDTIYAYRGVAARLRALLSPNQEAAFRTMLSLEKENNELRQDKADLMLNYMELVQRFEPQVSQAIEDRFGRPEKRHKNKEAKKEKKQKKDKKDKKSKREKQE